jgi:hypothetical protein
MIGVLHPFWLVALAVIPLIRWLHRWQAPMAAWTVSAIFLWEDAIQDDAPGPARRKPDPAWRRRAIIAALLVTALAKPFWRQDVESLTVWIDDSLSMSTLENGGTRLSAAMNSLSVALDETESSRALIELRSLSDPGRVVHYAGGDTLDAETWQMDIPTEPIGPQASLMSSETNHWLVTDGASETVRTWAQRVPVDRFIQVGVTTENSAVTRLAVRRSLDSPDGLDVLVSLSNTGLQSDVRQLELRSRELLLQQAEVLLPPGQTIHWQTQVVAVEPSLSASLAPQDSLSADDKLAIGLQKFRPLVAVVGANCGTALRLALATHPALQVSNTATNPDLRVNCPRDQFPDASGPEAQIRALISSARPLESTPTWLPGAGVRQDLVVPADWISAAAWPGQIAAPGNELVFGTLDTPLVVKRDGTGGSSSGRPAVVDTIIDMSNPLFTRQPEYPAFVATLVDLATGRDLLNESMVMSRNALASIVQPTQIDRRPGQAQNFQRTVNSSLSGFFVVMATLVLLLDLALILKTRRGVGHA